MPKTRVKICGITSPEDASAAIAAGADAVGVVFADSPRQVDLARAREVLAVVPDGVVKCGVFVDAGPATVEAAVAACGLDEVQYHGDESPEACAAAPAPVVKAFRVGGGYDPGAIDAYEGSIAAVLLDAYDPHERGGTGRSFAWEASGELPPWAPVIVAGGLTAANVGDAIEHFRPFGVDVSSGVEEWPGNKDRNRMAAFVDAVRRADRACGSATA